MTFSDCANLQSILTLCGNYSGSKSSDSSLAILVGEQK